MRIELKCACGATALFEDDSYINAGGAPDECGRVFVVQIETENWRLEHTHHATMYAPKRHMTGRVT